MKSIILLSISLFLYSPLKAQTEHIIGFTTPEEIRAQHRVFDIYVNRYEPDSIAVEFLSTIEDSISIKILFGTWCHDSKREIPAFMKVLEVVKNENIRAEYYGVTKEKTDPEGLYEQLELKYTPTFIIYKDNLEIGRIIEKPILSIEQDLAQILQTD